MFGLSALFNALARLTRSVNASADLFDAANNRMASLLSIDGPAEAPALEHRGDVEAEAVPAKAGRNGRTKRPV